MSGTIAIIGNSAGDLQALVAACGLRPVQVHIDQLANTPRTPVGIPDALLVDVRNDRTILTQVAAVKRRYPSMGVAIVARALDPELMLESMRAGVSEAIPEPLTPGAIQAAIGRVVAPKAVPMQSRIYAVIGAKGGVGATTIAVNLAAALARAVDDALLVDLNFAAGDAAVFLGVEPRFTVAEALENTHRLDEAFLRSLVVRSRSGLDLLGASPRLSPGTIDSARLRALVEFVGRYYHAVVLDVPRLDVSLLDALDAATAVMVVVNHELPTLRSAHRLVGLLRQRFGDRIQVVVNRSDKGAEIGVEDIQKTVGMKISHVFPNDYRQAVAAINRGQPLADGSQGRLPESFHSFARSLTGQPREAAPAPEASGLFGWLSPKRSSL
ncbi:MAG: AAA family ATPase [Acidobacteria bacterium]|nr:AAA family ATPase [Acidobacteriota bacterium]